MKTQEEKAREKRIRNILQQLNRSLLPDASDEDDDSIQSPNITMGLDDLIGLQRLRRMAKRDIRAALRSGEVFPHTGLFGPGGLGKTAFAQAMAKDLNYFFLQVEGAAIKNRKELLNLLVKGNENAIASNKNLLFFVDECHRLGTLQEALYYPMTDWRITTSSGEIRFNPFTLIAATTHPHMLMGSFTSRLQNQWYLERYSQHDIRKIVLKLFDKWGISQDIVTAGHIASRSLGIPRRAKNLARKVRNNVLARGGNRVTDADCFETFELEGIDEIGLDDRFIQYLHELASSDSPKGLSAIAGRMGLSEDVVSGSLEPTLLSLGMIDLTGRGRVLTKKGHQHLSKRTN